jgi:hypothetical protein
VLGMGMVLRSTNSKFAVVLTLSPHVLTMCSSGVAHTSQDGDWTQM